MANLFNFAGLVRIFKYLNFGGRLALSFQFFRKVAIYGQPVNIACHQVQCSYGKLASRHQMSTVTLNNHYVQIHIFFLSHLIVL
jgi:hypothetical protein